MFSNSQFDANNAFSGGGFLPSQPSQPADCQSSSSARSRDSQGLVLVTVKMITEATYSGDDKSNFMINGLEITNVTLVGLVFYKEERASDVNFILDDGTGRMQFKRWASEVFDTKEMEAVKDAMYVRLVGHLKRFQGKKTVSCFLCEVQVVSTTQPQTAYSSLNTSARTGSNGYNTAHQIMDCGQLILDYLHQPSSSEREREVHISELSQALKIPEKKITDSIASIENEGLVYSSVDEFHYKYARG